MRPNEGRSDWILAGGIGLAVSLGMAARAEAADWWVDARAGSDGDGSMGNPFASLQDGLAAAMPGDRVRVLPGTYAPIQTVRHGEPDDRIVVAAEIPRTVVVQGDGTALEVSHDHHTFEGIVFDGGYGPGDGIEGGSHDLEFVDVEVRRTTGDCVDLRDSTNVWIVGSVIHHCVAVFDPDNNADAHGVTGDSVFGLTIVDSEIYLTTGDAIQLSPSRSPWDGLWVERTVMWSGPLDEAANGWDAGTIIGENAFDSKVDAGELNGAESRPKATFVDVVAYGWRGSISNQGVFNVKEEVEFLLDRGTIWDSELAFRLRAPALARVQNVVVHDVDHVFRLEDGIADLQVFNATLGGAIASEPIDEAGGPAFNPVFRNVLVLADALPDLLGGASNMAVDSSVFVDPAGHDYRLLEGSSPVDAGEAIVGVDVDRESVMRPVGSAFDIGAFEWTDMPPGGTETADPDGGPSDDAGGTGRPGDDGSGDDASAGGDDPSGSTDGGTRGSEDGGGSQAGDAGCGCRASAPGAAASLGCLVLWVAGRRRGRKSVREEGR